LVTGAIVAPIRGWGVADQTSFSGSYDAFGDAPVSCPTHLLCLSLYSLGKGQCASLTARVLGATGYRRAFHKERHSRVDTTLQRWRRGQQRGASPSLVLYRHHSCRPTNPYCSKRQPAPGNTSPARNPSRQRPHNHQSRSAIQKIIRGNPVKDISPVSLIA